MSVDRLIEQLRTRDGGKKKIIQSHHGHQKCAGCVVVQMDLEYSVCRARREQMGTEAAGVEVSVLGSPCTDVWGCEAQGAVSSVCPRKTFLPCVAAISLLFVNYFGL